MSAKEKISWLETLKKQGKIRDYVIQGKTIKAELPSGRKRSKKGESKEWMWSHIKEWAEMIYEKKGYDVRIITEHLFHPVKEWRIDYAILIALQGKEVPFMKIAIEYEGINSKKSRHTTKGGYSEDTLKYNAITEHGYKLYRYTHKTHLNLEKDLKELIK